MRSTGDARSSWQLLEQAKDLSDLSTAIGIDGEPSSLVSGQRSACWKAFLLFESMNRSDWPSILADSRAAYNSLRAHFLRGIENPDELESALDPLTESEDSPWVTLRKDEALRAEIFQDVERCMPDNTYFRQPDTQKIMLDILFIFCKLNPDVGYRQGMHEVLAPILWVVEKDAVKSKEGQNGDLILNIYDSTYVEHDTFTLYGLIMQNAKTFYEPPKTKNSSDSPMLIRSQHIFEELLPAADPQLAAHLEQIEVAPQMFLMRWMRLLFGREFPFDDMLPMWDLIFAADPTLHLIDFISIAMLLRVRWGLLDADANTAITILLRYPQPAPEHPPRTLVHDAIQLKQALKPETGARLIFKYSGRAPEISSQQRPQTPRLERPGMKQRQKSQFGTVRGARSPAGGFQSILRDAARDIHARGEKWGLNQAVRDAVGDFKKTVKDIQQDLQAAQAPISPRLPIPEEFRKQAGSSTLLQKVTALEARNNALAKMLEGAVAELWDCQKAAIEKKETDKASVEGLSKAIAKVQFVQVYLEDASIPLPAEEMMHNEKPDLMSSSRDQPKTQAETENAKPLPSTPESSCTTVSAPPSSSTPPETFGGTLASSPPSSQLTDTTPKTIKLSSSSPDPSAPPRFRTSIAESSFSWMLDQDDSPNSPRRSATSSFAAASNYNSLKPVERRRKTPSSGTKRGNGSGGSSGGADEDGKGGSKAFLFGNDNDGFSDPIGTKKSVFGTMGAKETKETPRREVYDLGEFGGGRSGDGNGKRNEDESG